jgi:uncharacterized lipoprotein YajG
MKNIIYLLIAALFIGGCSYKNEAIELSTYKGEYSGENAKSKQAVYLRSVKDMRTDKKTIGSILANDIKEDSFYSNADFAEKYTKGLGYAFDLAGFKAVSNADDSTLILDVKIKKVEINYTNKTFEANLVGTLDIEVVMTRGQQVTTLNFRPKSSKWISPSFDSKDVEPFLYTLFSDSINEITSKLTNY